MAKNDAILVDGIIDQRVDEAFPSSVRSEVFEYFCFEQVLKNYDLSPEEIESGWVDGRDDGGIDGFFTLINGHLFRDPEDFSWPKTNCEITVWILTCKHHDTFQQSPLNSLVASVAELFDLSIDRKELKGSALGQFSRPERRSMPPIDAWQLPVRRFGFAWHMFPEATSLQWSRTSRLAQIRSLRRSVRFSVRASANSTSSVPLNLSQCIGVQRNSRLSCPFVNVFLTGNRRTWCLPASRKLLVL